MLGNLRHSVALAISRKGRQNYNFLADERTTEYHQTGERCDLYQNGNMVRGSSWSGATRAAWTFKHLSEIPSPPTHIWSLTKMKAGGSLCSLLRTLQSWIEMLVADKNVVNCWGVRKAGITGTAPNSFDFHRISIWLNFYFYFQSESFWVWITVLVSTCVGCQAPPWGAAPSALAAATHAAVPAPWLTAVMTGRSSHRAPSPCIDASGNND